MSASRDPAKTPDTDDSWRRGALAIAQFSAFSKQIPLLYLILLANTWTVAVNFMQAAPTWLTVQVPVAITLLCGARLIKWARNSRVRPDAETARKALWTTQVLAGLLTILLQAWAFALFGYGNAYQQVHIAFFLGLTAIACIFCLMHVRAAALMVTVGFGVPFTMLFGLTGNTTFISIAINMALVVGGMVCVLLIYSADFAALVHSRQVLERKNAETEKLNRENLRLANCDSLTGLGNRRLFFASLEEALTAAGTDGSRVGLGLLDLDGFKPVNDTFGHSVGDALLAALVERLEAVVGDAIAIYRVGGDEFALLARGAEIEKLKETAHGICAAIREPFYLGSTVVRIGGTIGLSIYPDQSEGSAELYEQADYSLYQAKRGGGRGEAWLFTKAYAEEMRRNSLIEQTLRGANLEDELSVVFQPIVSVAFRRLVGFEALARWTSPKLGVVSPAEFIPVAERAGLIGGLTMVLLKKALAVAESWPQPLRLSFNLSIHDIGSPESVMRLISIIGASGFNPKRLDLEITETAMVNDFSKVMAAVESLKGLGVGISLDDFGTGFSSLRQVHQLPLDKIKIDRSFTTGVHANANSRKIIRSLVSLCRDMELSCIVEGVETREELQALSELGCELVQGYFYSRPIPACEVAAFIDQARQAVTPEEERLALTEPGEMRISA